MIEILFCTEFGYREFFCMLYSFFCCVIFFPIYESWVFFFCDTRTGTKCELYKVGEYFLFACFVRVTMDTCVSGCGNESRSSGVLWSNARNGHRRLNTYLGRTQLMCVRVSKVTEVLITYQPVLDQQVTVQCKGSAACEHRFRGPSSLGAVSTPGQYPWCMYV